MLRFAVFAFLIFVGLPVAIAAHSHGQNKTIKQIAVEFAGAYEASDLGRLDKLRLIRGTVKIVIGYASVDEENVEADTVKRFRTFRQLEIWLRRRADKGLDNISRNRQTFAGCHRGRCDFENTRGSLHNQLYLQEILYGYRNGRFFIRQITLYNGD